MAIFYDCQGKLLSGNILLILDKRQKSLENQTFYYIFGQYQTPSLILSPNLHINLLQLPTPTLYTNPNHTLGACHRIQSEEQKFVSQEPQPQPYVWCVPENLKFSNLSHKNSSTNPNNLHQLSPHVMCLPDNLKFSTLTPTTLLVRSRESEVQAICLTKTPTSILTTYINPNHTFGAYQRTLSSAIYLARTPTSHTFGAYPRT